MDIQYCVPVRYRRCRISRKTSFDTTSLLKFTDVSRIIYASLMLTNIEILLLLFWHQVTFMNSLNRLSLILTDELSIYDN